MSLHHRVFLHSYLGFRSTSTLFYGERDAVLIDASQLLSDGHVMAAEIIRMRKRLTHVYASHFHPDHYFSLGVLQHAFPDDWEGDSVHRFLRRGLRHREDRARVGLAHTRPLSRCQGQ